MRHIFIEICLDSVESAIIAQEAGADRVELCANLSEGGITPSLGMIQAVRQAIDIPIHVMIRPRGGDFYYSDHEFEVMQKDISTVKLAGVDGVVLGILKPNGYVDIERTNMLVELARPMSVTFHRAFDMANDPMQSLEDIIHTGADRLLTSGQHETAWEGMAVIARLIEQANDRVVIMPGSGINETNVEALLATTQAREIHLSAGSRVESSVQFRPANIHLENYSSKTAYQMYRANPGKIKRLREILDK